MPLPGDIAGLPALCIASRREFDGMLLTAAIDAGVELVASRCVSIDRGNDGVINDTRSARPRADGRFLGADGVLSFVRRQWRGPSTVPTSPSLLFSLSTIRLFRSSSSMGRPGRLHLVVSCDHLAVGIRAQADEATSQALQTRVSVDRRTDRGRSPNVDFSMQLADPPLRASAARERAAGDRRMLLGDAAGSIRSRARGFILPCARLSSRPAAC